MSQHLGGVKKTPQEKLNKEIPYVHYLNHQLHHVIVYSLGQDDEIRQLFILCGSLYFLGDHLLIYHMKVFNCIASLR